MSTGIPTTYKGVRFRSRLEAKWAMMFDLFNWSWNYEPIDLEGYIPDFRVDLGKTRFIVEVKPEGHILDLQPAALKIDKTSYRGQVLIVGDNWSISTHGVPNLLFDEFPAIGAIRDDWYREEPIWNSEATDDQWSVARIAFCKMCGGVTIFSDRGSWSCRRCPGLDKHYHLCDVNGSLSEFLKNGWAGAANVTQWKGAPR